MDLRRLRIGDWIAAGWGAAMIASLFAQWYEAPGGGATAWEAFSTIDVILTLTGALAIALAIATARATSAALPIALDVITATVAAIALLLVLYRHINEPGPNALISIDAGAYIGLLATLGVFAGSVLAMRDERMPAVPPAPAPEPMPAPRA